MKPEEIRVGRYQGKSGPDRDVQVVCLDEFREMVVGYYFAGPTASLRWCSLKAFAKWAEKEVPGDGQLS